MSVSFTPAKTPVQPVNLSSNFNFPNREFGKNNVVPLAELNCFQRAHGTIGTAKCYEF